MSRNQIVHTPDEIIRIRRAAAITAHLRGHAHLPGAGAAFRPGRATRSASVSGFATRFTNKGEWR